MSNRSGYIVVLNSNGFEFGIRVDEVLDLEDSVVKKLGKHMKGLAHMQGIHSDESSAHRNQYAELQAKSTELTREVLLLDIGVPGVWGVELSQVGRLEKISKKEVQFSGEQPLLIYRNHTMPLFCLGNLLQYTNQSCSNSIDREEFNVLVFEKEGKNYGFMVREIIDLVHAKGEFSPLMNMKQGVLGGVIIGDKTVTMISLSEALAMKIPVSEPTSISSQSEVA